MLSIKPGYIPRTLVVYLDPSSSVAHWRGRVPALMLADEGMPISWTASLRHVKLSSYDMAIVIRSGMEALEDLQKVLHTLVKARLVVIVDTPEVCICDGVHGYIYPLDLHNNSKPCAIVDTYVHEDHWPGYSRWTDAPVIGIFGDPYRQLEDSNRVSLCVALTYAKEQGVRIVSDGAYPELDSWCTDTIAPDTIALPSLAVIRSSVDIALIPGKPSSTLVYETALSESLIICTDQARSILSPSTSMMLQSKQSGYNWAYAVEYALEHRYEGQRKALALRTSVLQRRSMVTGLERISRSWQEIYRICMGTFRTANTI